MKGFKGEEQFTSAILGVVNPKVPKVYFATGHGEHDPDGMDGDGYSQLRDAIKRDNLDVQKTSLLSGSIRQTVTCGDRGPSAPFADQEKTALKGYLEQGWARARPARSGAGCPQPSIGPRGLPQGVRRSGQRGPRDRPRPPAAVLRPAAVYVSEFHSHPVVDACRVLQCCCRSRGR